MIYSENACWEGFYHLEMSRLFGLNLLEAISNVDLNHHQFNRARPEYCCCRCNLHPIFLTFPRGFTKKMMRFSFTWFPFSHSCWNFAPRSLRTKLWGLPGPGMTNGDPGNPLVFFSSPTELQGSCLYHCCCCPPSFEQESKPAVMKLEANKGCVCGKGKPVGNFNGDQGI